MEKFSDFAEEPIVIIESKKINIADIVGKEIVVESYIVSESKFVNNEMITIYFTLNKKRYHIRTMSNTLKAQINKYYSKMPFITSIIKSRRNYVLS